MVITKAVAEGDVGFYSVYFSEASVTQATDPIPRTLVRATNNVGQHPVTGSDISVSTLTGGLCTDRQ